MNHRAWLPGGLSRFGVLAPLVALARMLWWLGQFIDGLAERLIKCFVRTRYERTGGCLKTGQCCEVIVMVPPDSMRRWPRLRLLIAKAGEVLYPFRLRGMEDDGFVYTCYNFDTERRICLNYRFRPKVCRDYPEVGFYTRPYFYKGCGFGIRLRGRKGSFVEALDKQRKRGS